MNTSSSAAAAGEGAARRAGVGAVDVLGEAVDALGTRWRRFAPAAAGARAAAGGAAEGARRAFEFLKKKNNFEFLSST